jgi:hypothetical protein
MKGVQWDEQYKAQLTWEVFYKNVIGDGRVIRWNIFVEDTKIVDILMNQYVCSLEEFGHIFDSNWPISSAAKKMEWRFNYYLDFICSQVRGNKESFNLKFAFELAESRVGVLNQKYKIKYKIPVASTKVQQDRDKAIKAHQLVEQNQVHEQERFQAERIETNKEMKNMGRKN